MHTFANLVTHVYKSSYYMQYMVPCINIIGKPI